MAYILHLVKCLFPGRSLESLTESECRILVTHVDRNLQNVYRVATIPEVVHRVLGNFPLRNREPLRKVSRTWDRAVCGLRTLLEASRVLEPVGVTSYRMMHLALSVIHPKYAAIARTQQEFDILWPVATTVAIENLPKFITPDKVCRACHLLRHLSSKPPLQTILQFPYESLPEVPPEFIWIEVEVFVALDTLGSCQLRPGVISWLHNRGVPLERVALWFLSKYHNSRIYSISQPFVAEEYNSGRSGYYQSIMTLYPKLGVYLYLYSPEGQWRNFYHIPSVVKPLFEHAEYCCDLPMRSPSVEEYHRVWSFL
jgi:hypothetical protein